MWGAGFCLWDCFRFFIDVSMSFSRCDLCFLATELCFIYMPLMKALCEFHSVKELPVDRALRSKNDFKDCCIFCVHYGRDLSKTSFCHLFALVFSFPPPTVIDTGA